MLHTPFTQAVVGPILASQYAEHHKNPVMIYQNVVSLFVMVNALYTKNESIHCDSSG